jgi:hypothetical protein
MFDAQGQALSGPATEPLRFLQLALEGENSQLVVDRAQHVEPAVRLRV